LPGVSSGLKIVTALVSSLKGVLCFTSDTTGPRFSIRIPLALGAVQVNALSAKM
jgi:sensor histidine kinase regulating citrate/malate metabolism